MKPRRARATTLDQDRSSRPGISLTVITFTPSLEEYTRLCESADQATTDLHTQRRIMPCDDLWRRLATLPQETQPVNSALFALMRSNLPPLSGAFVPVNVWISRRVLRWRALVESMLAEVYPDNFVVVLEQHSSPTPRVLFNPDFVVVDHSELSKLIPDVPVDCRLIVFASGLDAYSTSTRRARDSFLRLRHRAILLTRDVATLDHPTVPPRLYVPLASMVFSDSFVHSPAALLDPSRTRKPDFSPIEPFAIPQCTPRAASLLGSIQVVPTQSRECTPEKARSVSTRDHDQSFVNGTSTPDTIFAFDADVARYIQTKFVLAFESLQHTSLGSIAGSIVAAFIAGSVPIYDGDDATGSRLFNPKAFISCGRFASLRECGEFVGEVDRSLVLYEAMRHEPPVVNETAFYEVFSWHPDVLQRLRDDPRDDAERLDMVERLRAMINGV